MEKGERGANAVAVFADVPAFVRGLSFNYLPDDVVASAQRSLLDLIGVAAAGSRTRAAAIANAYAATQLCGSDRSARILFDGRRAGLAGTAFAGASTIDALDGHDGHALTKGHAGAAILPALLARDGFTGAPALTIERDDARAFWSDLGKRWRIREQYFKAYPVCRWAQPAIEAALDLQRAHRFAADDIATIEIDSFPEAVALGSQCANPRTTEEAQYSIAFAVAAALVFGRVGADEVDERGLSEMRVQRLLRNVALAEDAEFSRRF